MVLVNIELRNDIITLKIICIMQIIQILFYIPMMKLHNFHNKRYNYASENFPGPNN